MSPLGLPELVLINDSNSMGACQALLQVTHVYLLHVDLQLGVLQYVYELVPQQHYRQLLGSPWVRLTHQML